MTNPMDDFRSALLAVQTDNTRIVADLAKRAEKAARAESALRWIDGEAPSKEPRNGPTVGFQPSRDPEEDDGNETVLEAFQEGVARGLWLAANVARAALSGDDA